jgi:hypothetical protein
MKCFHLENTFYKEATNHALLYTGNDEVFPPTYTRILYTHTHAHTHVYVHVYTYMYIYIHTL